MQRNSQGIVLINQVLKDNLFDSWGYKKWIELASLRIEREKMWNIKVSGYNSEITMSSKVVHWWDIAF